MQHREKLNKIKPNTHNTINNTPSPIKRHKNTLTTTRSLKTKQLIYIYMYGNKHPHTQIIKTPTTHKTYTQNNKQKQNTTHNGQQRHTQQIKLIKTKQHTQHTQHTHNKQHPNTNTEQIQIKQTNKNTSTHNKRTHTMPHTQQTQNKLRQNTNKQNARHNQTTPTTSDKHIQQHTHLTTNTITTKQSKTTTTTRYTYIYPKHTLNTTQTKQSTTSQ